MVALSACLRRRWLPERAVMSITPGRVGAERDRYWRRVAFRQVPFAAFGRRLAGTPVPGCEGTVLVDSELDAVAGLVDMTIAGVPSKMTRRTLAARPFAAA